MWMTVMEMVGTKKPMGVPGGATNSEIHDIVM
jgi:hypothetical protein